MFEQQFKFTLILMEYQESCCLRLKLISQNINIISTIIFLVFMGAAFISVKLVTAAFQLYHSVVETYCKFAAHSY